MVGHGSRGAAVRGLARDGRCWIEASGGRVGRACARSLLVTDMQKCNPRISRNSCEVSDGRHSVLVVVAGMVRGDVRRELGGKQEGAANIGRGGMWWILRGHLILLGQTFVNPARNWNISLRHTRICPTCREVTCDASCSWDAVRAKCRCPLCLPEKFSPEDSLSLTGLGLHSVRAQPARGCRGHCGNGGMRKRRCMMSQSLRRGRGSDVSEFDSSE